MIKMTKKTLVYFSLGRLDAIVWAREHLDADKIYS